MTSCIINYNPRALEPITLKIYVVSYYVTETLAGFSMKIIRIRTYKDRRHHKSNIFVFILIQERDNHMCNDYYE